MLNEPTQPTKECAECASLYYADRSAMASLCPECAHVLYGYPACEHEFQHGRCTKCYWDGSVSEYIKSKNDE